MSLILFGLVFIIASICCVSYDKGRNFLGFFGFALIFVIGVCLVITGIENSDKDTEKEKIGYITEISQTKGLITASMNTLDFKLSEDFKVGDIVKVRYKLDNNNDGLEEVVSIVKLIEVVK